MAERSDFLISDLFTAEHNVHKRLFRHIRRRGIDQRVAQSARVVHLNIAEDSIVVVGHEVVQIPSGHNGQRRRSTRVVRRVGGGDGRGSELVGVLLIQVDFEGRAQIGRVARVGGQNDAGHVEEERPDSVHHAHHPVLVGHEHTVGSIEVSLPGIIVAGGVGGDALTFLGEGLDA